MGKPVHHEVIIDHNITEVHYVPVKKQVPYKYDTYKTVWHNETEQQPIQTVRPVYTKHQVVDQPQYQYQAPVYNETFQTAPFYQGQFDDEDDEVHTFQDVNAQL